MRSTDTAARAQPRLATSAPAPASATMAKAGSAGVNSAPVWSATIPIG
jgi:hypothetical protein